MVAAGLWQQDPAAPIGRSHVYSGFLPRLEIPRGVVHNGNVADETACDQLKPVSAREADRDGAGLQRDWGMLADIPKRWSWLVCLVLAGSSGDCWKQMSDDFPRSRDGRRPGHACMKPS